MNSLVNSANESKAARAFTGQSGVFDQLYNADPVIQYKRQRVREHILKYAKPGGRMLELNCGTGEDALFFAERGFSVHATDISSGMLEAFERKAGSSPHKDRISMEQCSFTRLELLKAQQPLDYIYSNFGGLNCTGDLEKVLTSLDALATPGAVVTLVVISKFCLWETLLLFKGKFKTAFRRFFAQKGRTAHVEGNFFKCWYYTPSFVERSVRAKFELLALEGLCTIVPPSYMEQFPHRHPGMFRWLQRMEERWKGRWPWNRIGDYFIITFRKK
jgi:ubiquinone/menaquinone biosynthesis C-methylase UbiE